jgi:hypothetical protein
MKPSPEPRTAKAAYRLNGKLFTQARKQSLSIGSECRSALRAVLAATHEAAEQLIRSRMGRRASV